MQLYIANQNYSTWSLRAWIVCVHFGLDVEFTKLKLGTNEFYQALETVNPAGKVPALIDGDVAVWDSLAIVEYLNEKVLNGKAWPADIGQRAKARAIASEMHSGFFAIRNEMPMNCRATRKVSLSEAAKEDIARIDAIWSQQMHDYPDGWLFGEWSIADAMFAPVVLRFMTYQTELSPLATQYLLKVLNSAPIQRWLAEASTETEIVAEDEAGTPL